MGRSEAGSVAHCQTTLLFLSTLKLARNFALASRISCSLCSSKWSCSSAGKVSQVGSIMLLGETSELSLEPAIEGRFDGSRCVFPSGVAKKYVDTFLGRQSLNTNQRWCSLRKGGRSAAWREAWFSCLMVRALGPDGPRVRRGGGRSPAAPGSRSQEGPRRGGEILGVV